MDLTVIVTIAGGLVSVGATLGGWVWSLSTKLTELDANQRNYAATLNEVKALVHNHDNRQDQSERQLEQVTTSVKNLQESLKEIKSDTKDTMTMLKDMVITNRELAFELKAVKEFIAEFRSNLMQKK